MTSRPFLLSDQGYTAKPLLPLQLQMESVWGQDRHHHNSWGSACSMSILPFSHKGIQEFWF